MGSTRTDATPLAPFGLHVVDPESKRAASHVRDFFRNVDCYYCKIIIRVQPTLIGAATAFDPLTRRDQILCISMVMDRLRSIHALFPS